MCCLDHWFSNLLYRIPSQKIFFSPSTIIMTDVIKYNNSRVYSRVVQIILNLQLNFDEPNEKGAPAPANTVMQCLHPLRSASVSGVAQHPSCFCILFL